MIAAWTKVAEIELDPREAHEMAIAIKNVNRHYEWLPGFAEKTVDWINLAQAVGEIYGPRLAAVQMRRATTKAAKPSPQPAGAQPTPAAAVAPAGTNGIKPASPQSAATTVEEYDLQGNDPRMIGIDTDR